MTYLYLSWDYYYRESSIPDDMDYLKKVTGHTEEEIQPVLDLMFVKLGEFWLETDIENQLFEYRKHRESSKKGGINSGKSRAKKPVVGGIFGGPPRMKSKAPSTPLEVPLNTPSTPLEANRSIQLDHIPY
jgi:hypothetical protein